MRTETINGPAVKDGEALREDKELAALCGRGDTEAFEVLLSRYEKRIFAMAVRLSGNYQEGEDLAQETFLKAWKAITINPAVITGISDRVGSLEVGKDADIAIFDGHPFCNFTHCTHTIIDGAVYGPHAMA